MCAPQESGFISVTLPTNGSYTIFIEPYVWFYAYTNDLVSVTGSMTLQLFQDQTGHSRSTVQRSRPAHFWVRWQTSPSAERPDSK